MAKSAVLTTITPQMAKDLLASNKNNRKISKRIVNQYARDMLEGRWKNNGQSILAAEDGTLIDGQHRLMACVQSGVPFQAFLVRGVPEETRSTIDAGRKRSAADALFLSGHTPYHTTGVAASARLIINYLRGESLSQTPSASEIFEFVEAQPEVSEKHILGAPAAKVVPKSVLGAVLYLGTREDGYTRKASSFAEGLTHGEGLTEGDPRLTVRNLLINTRQRTPGGNMPLPTWTLPVLAQAWNAYARGERINLIRPSPNKQGRFIVPNIVGGPEFGAGISSVMEGHLSKARVAQLKATEQRERAKLLEKAK